MAETADDYHHGDMEVAEHVAAYRTFGTLTKWGALFIGVLILMLTLWFCTDAGFVGGLFTGVIVLAAGIWFLRASPSQ